MLTYQWLDRIGPDVEQDLSGLVVRAATFDAEMGFSKIVLADPPETAHLPRPEPRTYHLLARMSRRTCGPSLVPAQALVAYVRADVSGVDESATLSFVVGPESRSLGVATLLFELLEQDTASGRGWSVTGATHLQAWAHGNHPAAQRMARRFGARAAHRRWRLCRPLAGPGSDVPRSPEPDGLTVRRLSEREQCLIEEVGDLVASVPNRVPSSQRRPGPDVHSADFFLAIREPGVLVGVLATSGHPGSPHPGAGSIRTLAVRSGQDGGAIERALLEKGIAHLRAGGAHTIDVYVDPADKRMVHTCRSLGFGHDQTDVCYAWPRIRSVPAGKSSTTARCLR